MIASVAASRRNLCVIGIACMLLTVASCSGAAGAAQSAKKDMATQAQAQPDLGSVAAAGASQMLVWRVAAAAEAAAAGPHGDIGEAAVATAP